MWVAFASAAMVEGGKLTMLLVVVGGSMTRLSRCKNGGMSLGVGMMWTEIS